MKQILSLIIILSVILLTGCANSNTIYSPLVNTTPTVEVSTPTKNVAGLNDVVNVGDLSVKLFMVKLTTLNLSITTELNGNISAKTYLMLQCYQYWRKYSIYF